MILDSLQNASLHEGVHTSFPKAFAWLNALDPSLPDGRYEIDGTGLVAIMQRYETAPAASKKWETHRVHGDIQYMVSGTELVGHAWRGGLSTLTAYNEEKDAEFYHPPSVSSLLRFEQGSFAVFMPHDAHQPGVMDGPPAGVVKVVVKFLL